MTTLLTFVILLFTWTPDVSAVPTVEPFNPEVIIPESEAERFTDDPVAYICQNFKIKEHSEFANSIGESVFYVTFRCAKGSLTAEYDSEGNLIATRQKFKNVSLPPEIRTEIYRDYKGWEVTNINYKARGKGEVVKNRRYVIRLEKEGQKKVLRKRIKH